MALLTTFMICARSVVGAGIDHPMPAMLGPVTASAFVQAHASQRAGIAAHDTSCRIIVRLRETGSGEVLLGAPYCDRQANHEKTIGRLEHESAAQGLRYQRPVFRHLHRALQARQQWGADSSMLAADRDIRDKFPVRAKRWKHNRDSIDLIPFYLFQIDASKDAEEIYALLKAHPAVEYAEPDQRVSIYSEPACPYFGQQWALHNIAQPYPVSGGRTKTGTEDADIDCPEALQAFTGTEEVVVAIVDSGVDYNHPDLAARPITL